MVYSLQKIEFVNISNNMIISFMDEINKAYTAYYEYTNDFIKSAYNATEQDKKEIQQLNKDKKELNKKINDLNEEMEDLNKDIEDLNEEKQHLNEEIYNLKNKIQDTNKKNILLVKKEIESTTLILKLDKTIANLRDELRKLKDTK